MAPRAGSLARSSLCLLAVALATPACLVTSTPSFEPPERTAPFLIAASAIPDARSAIIIDEAERHFVAFSVDVISEDSGQDVVFVLYVDYGFKLAETDDPANLLLYRDSLPNIRALPPSTMTDPKLRTMHTTWFPQATGTINHGCHTATLMASHGFDPESQCPKCLNDSSQITWQVFLCNSAKGDDCKPDFSKCQDWTRSCPPVPNPDDIGECGG